MSQTSSAEEGSSDPIFADHLRTWVETLIPQILAAKDIQSVLITILSVSYTHLDVYKRQYLLIHFQTIKLTIPHNLIKTPLK